MVHLVNQVRDCLQKACHLRSLTLSVGADHQVFSCLPAQRVAHGFDGEVDSLQNLVHVDFYSPSVVPYEVEGFPLVLVERISL